MQDIPTGELIKSLVDSGVTVTLLFYFVFALNRSLQTLTDKIASLITEIQRDKD